jgi:hypothetical protein
VRFGRFGLGVLKQLPFNGFQETLPVDHLLRAHGTSDELAQIFEENSCCPQFGVNARCEVPNESVLDLTDVCIRFRAREVRLIHASDAAECASPVQMRRRKYLGILRRVLDRPLEPDRRMPGITLGEANFTPRDFRFGDHCRRRSELGGPQCRISG